MSTLIYGGIHLVVSESILQRHFEHLVFEVPLEFFW